MKTVEVDPNFTLARNFSYNVNKQLAEISAQHSNPANNYTISYAYDSAGRLSAAKRIAGTYNRLMEFTYDAQGRLSRFTDNFNRTLNSISTLTYSANNLVRTIVSKNATTGNIDYTETDTYDANKNLLKVETAITDPAQLDYATVYTGYDNTPYQPYTSITDYSTFAKVVEPKNNPATVRCTNSDNSLFSNMALTYEKDAEGYVTKVIKKDLKNNTQSETTATWQ